TVGYVPAAGISKSGVTIATGFDLGQRNESDLKLLKLDALLKAKLKPYLGVKGKAAQDLIKKTPLVINLHQAQAIDKAVKSAHVAQLKLKYNASTSKKKFTDLPSPAQTVIASVSFQYGVGLDVRAPKFWKAVTSQD
ncbi:MAG: pesticin C-terminus-like muramidase, partial [Gammaproteobacteria bacterium]